ncbi:hypothetical protein T439DRAFT_323632 [Meredithblackwellia eburnea MCA 4105]
MQNSNKQSITTPPQTLVIPLSPPPPASHSLAAGSGSGSESESDQHILIEYFARLARFEPRLSRYAQRKSNELKEPVSAFLDIPPGAPSSSTSNTPTRDEINNTPGLGLSIHNKSAATATLSTTHSGFSLVDLERWILESKPAKWWTGDSSSPAHNSPSASAVQHAPGLDIDLSDAFPDLSPLNTPANIESTSSSRATSTSASHSKFLNYYTSDQLIHLLSTSGVLSSLASKGYTNPSLVFDTSDPFLHRLSLVDERLFVSPGISLLSTERFLIDLYMKRRREWGLDSIVAYQLMNRLVTAGSWEKLRDMTGEIRSPFVGIEGARETLVFLQEFVPKAAKSAKKGTGHLDVSEIAWMQMHDPFAPVTRDLLPGQRFPGLGLGRQIASLMEAMATTSRVTDALVNFPFHFHNAVAYESLGYIHLDPIYQAYVSWLSSQMAPYHEIHGYAFVSWAVSLGHVRRITEEQVDLNNPDAGWRRLSNRLERWSPSEQLYPTGTALSSLLESKEWKRLNEKYRAVFDKDGGANLEGVTIGADAEDETQRKRKLRRARLIIDEEGCPEIWKYSKAWRRRNPETGEFH